MYQKHKEMTDLQIMRNPHSDRDRVLKAVRKNPSILGWACDAFKDDYVVVLTAVTGTKYAADAFVHASPRLRADRRIAEECVVNDKYMECISFVDPSLLSDREFILEVLGTRPYVFSYSTVPWTRDFLMDCVVANSRIMEDLPDEYLTDRQFALDVIAKGGNILGYLSDELKDDAEVVLAQFRIEYGGQLENASHRLQRDREIVLEAVRTAPTQLEYIRLFLEYTPEERERLLSDVEIVMTAAAESGGCIRYASQACRTNRIVVMTALTSKEPTNLRSVPSCLTSDPCIRLCVPANNQSTINALLTVLETEMDTYAVCEWKKLMYKHKIGRPFTAETVLSLFESVKDTPSTERLDALATLVNECPSEHVHDTFSGWLNGGNAVLEELFTHYETPTPDKWLAHGVCDTVADRLQRLGQIADALPYIDRAMRRSGGNLAFRDKCIARVDALAAKVHHPTGTYASIVHKRSYTEAFA